MNNEFYPSDINIRIETSDVEEIDKSDIHLVDVQVVDGRSTIDIDEDGTNERNIGSYCDKVQQAVDMINSHNAPAFIQQPDSS